MNGIEIAKKLLRERFCFVIANTDIHPIDVSSGIAQRYWEGIREDYDEGQVAERLNRMRDVIFGDFRLAKLSDAFLKEMEKRFSPKVSAEPQPLKTTRK